MPMFKRTNAPPLARRAALCGLFVVLVTAFPVAAGAVGLTRLEFLQQSVKTSGQSFVSGLGFRAHLAGGDLNDGLVFVPSLEYWRDVRRLPDLGVPFVEQRDWRIGADMHYRFGDGKSWTPYAGAGLGLHLVKSAVEISVPGQPEVSKEENDQNLAVNLLLGLDFPMAGPIRNAIEFNYDLVPDLKQFKVNFGIGYVFGAKAEE